MTSCRWCATSFEPKLLALVLSLSDFFGVSLSLSLLFDRLLALSLDQPSFSETSPISIVRGATESIDAVCLVFRLMRFWIRFPGWLFVCAVTGAGGSASFELDSDLALSTFDCLIMGRMPLHQFYSASIALALGYAGDSNVRE